MGAVGHTAMRHYSSEMKETMVTKLCSPGGPTYSQLAMESGIGVSTLHNWVKKLGGRDHLKKPKRSQDWTASEKLQAVFEAQNLSELELGEFLRRSGLYSHDIVTWKAEALADTAQKRLAGRPKKDPELIEKDAKIKALERELRRKEKALAEAAALIILKKRVEEIWGKDEGDE